jgi:shikimate dehydrogenase
MTITATTQLYGLLGYPAKQSLSPVIQNGWMSDHAIDAVYLALEIQPDRFEATLEGLVSAGFAGANVTIPFKERAASFAQKLIGSVEIARSANVLDFRDGQSVAYSTDGEGLLADLAARAPHWTQLDGPIVVLGAGGAARAIAFAMVQAGRSDVRLVNRTLSRAQQIVDLLPVGSASAWAWSDMAEALDGAAFVINATARGLKGIEPLTLELGMVHPKAVIYDTVYVPRQTAFLQSAVAQGFVALDGLGMLVGQGALAFQHWFGIMPDIEAGLKRLEGS